MSVFLRHKEIQYKVIERFVSFNSKLFIMIRLMLLTIYPNSRHIVGRFWFSQIQLLVTSQFSQFYMCREIDADNQILVRQSEYFPNCQGPLGLLVLNSLTK